MIGESKFVDFCNVDLNVQLALRNSVPFGKKFASSDKFNAFISGNVDGFKVVNVYWDDNFWNIFWGWNGFKLVFFYPVKTLLDTKAFDLIHINIKTQFAREMRLESSLETILVFSAKLCFNGANMPTLSGWIKCEICKNKMNKSIKYFIQKAMKLTIIWLLWPFIINKCRCVRFFGHMLGSKTVINHLWLCESEIQLLLLVRNHWFKGIPKEIQTEFVCCVLKMNNSNNISPAALMHSIAVIHFRLF